MIDNFRLNNHHFQMNLVLSLFKIIDRVSKKGTIMLVLILSFCYHTPVSTQTLQTVKLRIISIDWSGKKWDCGLPDTTLVEIQAGQNFGSKDDPLYFKLIEIIDEKTIKLEFKDDLVVAGEPVAYPSKQNPIIISGTTNCFRTRMYDGGTDYCIDILGAGKL